MTMTLTRWCTIQGLFFACSSSWGAPVGVLPGDTLSATFHFASPYTDVPNALGFAFWAANQPDTSSRTWSYALANGSTPLGAMTSSGAGVVGGAFVAPDYPVQGLPFVVDFTAIRDRSIAGVLSTTISSGATFIFDPLQRPFPTSSLKSVMVYANSENGFGTASRQYTATIDSVSLNGTTLYKIPAAFSSRHAVNPNIGCGGPTPGIFVACGGFDYAFDGSSFNISMDIGLRGATTPTLTSAWESAIETYWGKPNTAGRYSIVDGPNSYPITFDVDFVGPNDQAAVYVDVIPGAGRSNSAMWYETSSAGAIYNAATVAHEFGHLIGLFDEYLPDGTLGPFGARCDSQLYLTDPANINCDGLMGSLSRDVVSRYYDQIIDTFFGDTGHQVVLGRSPLPAPDLPPELVGPFEIPPNPARSVQEPATVLLALGALAVMRRNVRRLSRTA